MKKAIREYLIRSYEGDAFGNLRIVTLFNIMQDVADFHAAELGLGLEFCHSKGLAWVGANYHVKIKKLPKIHQKIVVHSWPSAEKKLGAIREFLFFDENGVELIRASSQWILIDFAKKRPVCLKDHLPDYQIIPERALETNFEKIENGSEPTKKTAFKIRFDDIDVNGHVNNAVYPLWASEALDDDFRKKHMPSEIEVIFKKEGLLGENVNVASILDNQISRHYIFSASDERELARVKIMWA